MEPTPLDYAPPQQQRRSVFVAGLVAHVIASYAVSVVRLALWAILAWPPPTIAFAVAAAAPLWVPIGFVLPMALAGRPLLPLIGVICVYAALLMFLYRRLRKPRGT